MYVQGLPTVGNSGSSNAAASQMSIDATQFGAVGDDMCKKISLACATLGTTNYPKGATIDARGFTGNQVCAASTATIMLNGCVTGTNQNGGKLLLGNVNLYIDGPVPPATSYTDGSSGVGTPGDHHSQHVLGHRRQQPRCDSERHQRRAGHFHLPLPNQQSADGLQSHDSSLPHSLVPNFLQYGKRQYHDDSFEHVTAFGVVLSRRVGDGQGE